MIMRFSGRAGSAPAVRLALLALLIASAVLGRPTEAEADTAAGIEAYDGGDFARALAEFESAARSGDTSAQVALASMYQFGEGVARDLAKARHWYERAAASGDASAQVNLAALYADGIGVPRDPAEAFAWLSLAADQGHPWAVARRDDWAARLTADEAARAASLVAERTPRSAPSRVSGTARVIDGETLVVDGRTLRLEGIDAPALGTLCNLRGTERDCGLISSSALKDLTAGATVICALRSARAADGVRTARCEADGYDLSEGMVYTGWARADRIQMERYVGLETASRNAGRGMWRAP